MRYRNPEELYPIPRCRGFWQFPHAVVLGSLGQDPEVADIVCPAGTSVNADAQGNVWCEDPAGNKSSATLKPSATKVEKPGLMGALGPLGVGAVVAAAILGAAALVSRRR